MGGKSYGRMVIENPCIGSITGRDRRQAYQSMRNTVMHQTIVVDHIATASVCSRLFLGILDGTNLR